ncbi:MAG: DUF4136 domain-containing protein [Halioglobus sp.]
MDSFVAGDYHYYRWSNEPLVNTNNSKDIIYTLDPILRTQLNQELQRKGYMLDPERAEFAVEYIYAEGIRLGERSRNASNLGTAPGSIPNRNMDQASIDNAYALGGVKETSNIGIRFRDIESGAEVWRVVITKIIEDVNSTDRSYMRHEVEKAMQLGTKDLPPATVL